MPSAASNSDPAISETSLPNHDDHKENASSDLHDNDQGHQPQYLQYRPTLVSSTNRNFAIRPVNTDYELSPSFSPIHSPMVSSIPNEILNDNDSTGKEYSSYASPFTSSEFDNITASSSPAAHPIPTSTLTSRVLHIDPPNHSNTRIYPANVSSHYIPDKKAHSNRSQYAHQRLDTSLTFRSALTQSFFGKTICKQIEKACLQFATRFPILGNFRRKWSSSSLSIKQFALICVASLYILFAFILRYYVYAPSTSSTLSARVVMETVEMSSNQWNSIDNFKHENYRSSEYGNYEVNSQSREDIIEKLLAERPCSATDISCYISELSSNTFSFLWKENTFLVLPVSSNRLDLATNLICSGHSSGIDPSQWIIIAGDVQTFYFFLLRRIHVVLPPSLSDTNFTDSVIPSPQNHARRQNPLTSAKYLVIHELLRKKFNVLSVNLHMILLQPLTNLPHFETDIIGVPLQEGPTSLQLLETIACNSDSTDPQCAQTISLFHGFYYIQPSTNSILFIETILSRLANDPKESEKNAFLGVIQEWITNNRIVKAKSDLEATNNKWLPSLDRWKSSDDSNVLTISYFNPTKVTDVSVFVQQNKDDIRAILRNNNQERLPVLLFSRTMPLLASHQQYLRDYGIWFATPQLSCVASNPFDLDNLNNTDSLIPHRPSSRARLSPITPLDDHIPYATSTPLLLFFSSPKPISTFRNLPTKREADEDGLGEARGSKEMTNLELAEYLRMGEIQLEAQLLVLRSWFGLGRGGEVETMLFSKDVSHRILAEELSFDLIDRFGADTYGAPKLHSVFRTAEHIASHRGIPYCMYANGDLMFGKNLLETLEALKTYNFPEFLAVGIRHVLPVDKFEGIRNNNSFIFKEEMDQLKYSNIQLENGQIHKAKFGQISTDSLFDSLLAESHVFQSTEAIDYFLYSRGLWNWQDVPRFLLGRIAFDNWLLNWANRRESTTVIDISETVTALHIDHSYNSFASHRAPNSLINLKLGGQSSRRGIGRLEYTAFKTIHRQDGQVIVVRKKPESGLTRNLYELAEKACLLIHERPTIIIVTVNDAFVPIFRNWLATMMLARGSTKGILVLSAGSNATACATQYNLPVFNFATGKDQYELLNSKENSYLQILAFRSKAILLLLEFGYDILNSHVDEVWLTDPFAFLQQELTLLDEDVTDNTGASKRPSSTVSPQASSISTLGSSTLPNLAPTSTRDDNTRENESARFASEYDMIGLLYPNSINDYNVSMGGLYIRHSPESLRVWKRLRAQHNALMARSSMSDGLNLANLQEDWYLQYELKENPDIRWVSLSIEENRHMPSNVPKNARTSPKSKVPMHRFLTFKEYCAGVFHGNHHTKVYQRQTEKGFWLIEKL